jgi:hypothetical protein
VRRREVALLCLLLAAALALRVAAAFAIAPLQAPDERAHLAFVDHLLEQRRLPVQPPADWHAAAQRWEEFFQPPLAYLLYVPAALTATALGASRVGRLRVLRLQNALYGSAAVAVAFVALARLGAAGDPRRWLVAGLLAFLPGFVGTTSAVNNDGLACLLASAVWLPLLGPATRWRNALLGLLLALACLAKLTAIALLPVILCEPLLRRAPRREFLRRAIVVGAWVSLLLGPWLVRNLALYGDLTGGARGFLSFGSLKGVLPPDAFEAVTRPDPGKAFLQFWGRFGVANNLDWVAVPALWIPFFAAGVLGWLRRTPPGGDRLRRAAPLFLLAVAVSATALVALSLQYYSGWQGRHLYAALLPTAALLAGGWASALGRRLTPAVVGAVLLTWLALDLALVWKLQQFFLDTRPLRWGLRCSL